MPTEGACAHFTVLYVARARMIARKPWATVPQGITTASSLRPTAHCPDACQVGLREMNMVDCIPSGEGDDA